MCLQKTKTSKSLKNKIARAFDFTFIELCLLFIMLYVSIVLWNSQPDPPPKTHQSEPNLKQKPEKQRRYLNYTNNPTIIHWTDFKITTDLFSTIECGNICDVYWTNEKLMLPPNSGGAYIFYGSRTHFTNLPLPRNPQKVIWAFQHEESPKNELHFMHEKALALFNYSSTFSRYSDVPYPLHYITSLEHITSTKYFVKTEAKNRALKEIAPILYLQSSCGTPTERDDYVKELMKYQRIDSYGACLNNKQLPNYLKEMNSDYLNNMFEKSFLTFIARYKFMLTIENGVCHDYITEKFWRAIHLGVVPIYFGAPTIRDWMPNNKSALILDDFPSAELLSARINTLMKYDNLYEEYLQHKTKALISNQRIIEEIKARPYQTDDFAKDLEFMCFICKKLYQKNNSVQVVPKSHYNCPKPKPILANPDITWQILWDTYKKQSEDLYDEIMYF